MFGYHLLHFMGVHDVYPSMPSQDLRQIFLCRDLHDNFFSLISYSFHKIPRTRLALPTEFLTVPTVYIARMFLIVEPNARRSHSETVRVSTSAQGPICPCLKGVQTTTNCSESSGSLSNTLRLIGLGFFSARAIGYTSSFMDIDRGRRELLRMMHLALEFSFKSEDRVEVTEMTVSVDTVDSVKFNDAHRASD